jgi:hypothetical protein
MESVKKNSTGPHSLLHPSSSNGAQRGHPWTQQSQFLCPQSNVSHTVSPGENNAPPQDVLPGSQLDQQMQALADALSLYDTKNTAQGAQQTAASGTLEDIIAKIATLAGLRHQVQLAADQAWPWRTPGVATIRKDLLLPVDRRLAD